MDEVLSSYWGVFVALTLLLLVALAYKTQVALNARDSLEKSLRNFPASERKAIGKLWDSASICGALIMAVIAFAVLAFIGISLEG